MNSTQMIFGILAAGLNFIGFIPYFRDIFLHKTKPERAMWWIYSVLFGVLWAAQLDAGAKWLLISTSGYVITSLGIAILSLKFGYGSFRKRDVLSLIVALLGLILWKVTNDPLLAIMIVIAVDAVGFWLTIYKTWYAPRSETLFSWVLALVSTVISLWSIDSMNVSLIIYPLYAILADFILVLVILRRRSRTTKDNVNI